VILTVLLPGMKSNSKLFYFAIPILVLGFLFVTKPSEEELKTSASEQLRNEIAGKTNSSFGENLSMAVISNNLQVNDYVFFNTVTFKSRSVGLGILGQYISLD
jgi:hypothetical protein